MSRTWLLFLCVAVCAGAGSAEFVIVGQSVKLVADGECRLDEEPKLMTDDSSRTVARLVSGVWEPGEGYEDRIEHDSRSSVVLKRVNYNDNRLFEFFCGNRAVKPLQLMVRVASSIRAAQGQPATLPCHSFTGGRTRGTVRWEKDGILVCEVDPSTREIRYRGGFDRVSVPSDWYQTGDMSLTFPEVQQEDQGVYTCQAQDEHGKRSFVPVSLMVTASTPDQTAGTLDQTAGTPSPHHICIGVGAAVGLLLFLAGGVLGAYVHSRQKATSERRRVQL